MTKRKRRTSRPGQILLKVFLFGYNATSRTWPTIPRGSYVKMSGVIVAKLDKNTSTPNVYLRLNNENELMINGKQDDVICSPAASDKEITNAELGLAENHFSVPEGHFGLSTTEELEMAIEHCKEIILETSEKSDRRKNLVKKLVHLRIKLQELKEGPEILPEDVYIVLGHHFQKRQVDRPQVKRFCEKCNGNIWGVLHAWYQCQECRFSCHARCLNFITRICASIKIQENPTYVTKICPEVGLSAQKYRCAECKSSIMNTNVVGMSCFGNPFSSEAQCSEPRLCDYNGRYYCPLCHWNSVMVIPSRVIHNWDFETQKVCRASKQFLQLMRRKAILNLEEYNPRLFSFVDELGLIKKLRTDILSMKQYFLSCRVALESKLLLQLSSRQHFVDGADMYSMQDLEDVDSGVLVEFLGAIHANFSRHIKEDCQICRGNGYICEVCNTSEILYPFDDVSVTCPGCSTVFHKECFYRRGQVCPKCQRLADKMTNSLNIEEATLT